MYTFYEILDVHQFELWYVLNFHSTSKILVWKDSTRIFWFQFHPVKWWWKRDQQSCYTETFTAALLSIVLFRLLPLPRTNIPFKKPGSFCLNQEVTLLSQSARTTKPYSYLNNIILNFIVENCLTGFNLHVYN